ncbi:MAG TPA: hypothetical protein VGS22_01860 [Thermoanaerobaculia bacterium]|jgi:hypothetical protein|nr:hypothetical protein [Thermoanaerobaculia bacterium]
MATQEWIEAARAYRAMTEAQRAEYWQRLSTAQQQELMSALELPEPAASASTAESRSGCGPKIGIGCLGMFVGAVLTISVEAALVMQGVSFIGDLIGDLSSNSQTEPRPEPNPPRPVTPDRTVDCADPAQRERNRQYCENEEWCKDLEVKFEVRCGRNP